MAQTSNRIKLRGRSVADIVTLSGMVQDALLVPHDMTVETQKRRFVAIINRFMWERVSQQDLESIDAPTTSSNQHEPEREDAKFEDAGDGKFWRIQSALVIERANRVRRKGLEAAPNAKPGGNESFLYLLSMVPDDNAVTLYFAGGGMIRAEGPALEVFLEDVSEPWPTPQMPLHDAVNDDK